MKIVHIINSLATGGAERFLVDLVDCGNQLGHEVSIVTLTGQRGIPHQLSETRELRVSSLGERLYDPRNLVRLKKATNDADIIHVHLFPAFYLAAFINKPKVYTEHSSHNNRRNRPVLAPLEKLAYDQYDRIIAISDGVEKSLADHLHKIHSRAKVSFAPNGVTGEFFSTDPNYSKKPSKIVIIGSLRAVKQHNLAIQAISLTTGLTLTIAGDGELREELKSQVEALGLQERVKFLGNVNNIPDLLKNHDVLLSTSKYEGMSTVAVEAQAVGLPVVGPDVPGIRDVVQHGVTGLLFSNHRPEVVADTLTQAVEPSVYHALASATKPHAMQFSIGNSFSAQLKIYQEVINSYSKHQSSFES